MTEETDRPSDSVEEEVLAKLEAETSTTTNADDDASGDESEKSGAKRLTAEQWHEIETHWEYGTKKAVEMVAEYGVSVSSLTKHFNRHGIIRGSKKGVAKAKTESGIMGAVAAAVDPLAIAYEQKRKARITQTRESFMNQSAALTSRWNKIEKEILDGTRTEAECANDFKGMRHAALAAKVIVETRLAVLNADADIDEAKMPTLIFRDLTEEEIQRKADKDDDDDDLGLALPLIPEDDDEDEIIEEGSS